MASPSPAGRISFLSKQSVMSMLMTLFHKLFLAMQTSADHACMIILECRHSSLLLFVRLLWLLDIFPTHVIRLLDWPKHVIFFFFFS